MNGTATAHRAWDERWRSEDGRTEWVTPESEVVRRAAGLRQAGARRVLDLGTGIGRHALALAALGFEVEACDASEAGIALLADEAARQRLPMGTRQVMMTELPYGEATFDYVLAFNVIYHGDGAVVRRTIAEIARVLTPGGTLQATMLSKRNAKYGLGTEIAPDTFVIDEEGDKRHPHFYCSAAELVALLAGFDVRELVDTEQKAGAWHWHVVAERV